jgi:hypothetical protein
MGSPVSQVSSSTQPQGKGFASPAQPNAVDGQTAETMSPAVQPIGQFAQGSGKGGRVTTPGQGGQPRMGVPNNYSNTVGQWDNASIQPRQTQSGKGKGY